MIRLSPAVLLVVLAGCIPCTGVAPRDAREALQRVNDNLSRINETLLCRPATVSFRFRDTDGRTHRFIGQPAALLFRGPRCLYFDIRQALAGTVAHVGSNDRKYWLWVEADVSTIWSGSWANIGAANKSGLPLKPDQLIDALMLRPLPERAAGGLPPLLRMDGKKHRLLYMALDDASWPYVELEVVLDCCPPYMPLELFKRDVNGATVMHARYKKYRRVGDDGPYTPRRYVVDWEQDDVQLRLDVNGAKFKPDAGDFCLFPNDLTRWDNQIDLDRSRPPADGARARRNQE